MHNKNIKGDYYTYHLFCLFLQFCEAFKQLARVAFVQNVQFSHTFKRDKSATMNIFRFFFYSLFKSFVKLELSYVSQ